MVTIYQGDLDRLRVEGWELGTYWATQGNSGWYIRDPRHPRWVAVRVTPCSEDSLSYARHKGERGMSAALRRKIEEVEEM